LPGSTSTTTARQFWFERVAGVVPGGTEKIVSRTRLIEE